MWNSRKRSSLFCVMLVLVCASLLAFPGRGNTSVKEEAMEILEIQEELPIMSAEVDALVENVPVVEAIENSQENISTQLYNLLMEYENESRLNKNELGLLIEKLETIRDEYEVLCEDMEAKEIEIGNLTDLNAKQADDLAYLRGAYDKERGVKAMADVGMVIGFEKNQPTWGLSSSIGLRFGKGFLVKLGGQYMIGNFTAAPILDFALDNMSISASFGWEW